MADGKHTPGKWVADREYESDDRTFVHCAGRAIADCANGYGAEDEANASLIAAAPELLAALKMMVNAVGNKPVTSVDEAERIALGAIAKATGQ